MEILKTMPIKRIIYITLLLILICTTDINFAYSENKLFINEQFIDTYKNMYTQDNCNYIRLDLLLNYDINMYKKEAKFINLKYYVSNNKYIAVLGNKVIGNTLLQDLEYEVINNNIYIPIKFVSQIDENYQVSWNDKYKFVWLKNSNLEVTEEDLVYNNIYRLNIKNIDGIISPVNPKKVAYLTFDDGPSKKVTPQILDTLKEYDVKATFFINGVNIAGKEEVLKREVNEGHTVGNHTYSHKSGMYKSLDTFKNEVLSNNNKIYETTGYTSTVFRAPYGNTLSDSYKSFLKQNGFTSYYWNVDPGDSVAKGITANQIIGKIKSQIQNKNDVIIILHDMDNKTQTAKSIKGVIKLLWENGYELKNLDPNVKVNGAVRIY